MCAQELRVPSVSRRMRVSDALKLELLVGRCSLQTERVAKALNPCPVQNQYVLLTSEPPLLLLLWVPSPPVCPLRQAVFLCTHAVSQLPPSPCSGPGYEPQPPQLQAFSPSTGVAPTFQITVICEFHRWLVSAAPPCSLTGGRARRSLAHHSQ